VKVGSETYSPPFFRQRLPSLLPSFLIPSPLLRAQALPPTLATTALSATMVKKGATTDASGEVTKKGKKVQSSRNPNAPDIGA
jgi:hypothetical protein